MSDWVKCTKHQNCKIHDGSHLMTLYFEHTIHDFKEGAATTKKYTGAALEALSNESIDGQPEAKLKGEQKGEQKDE